MNNVLIGLDKSGSYRIYLAISTGLAEEARRIHDTTPVATAALGRVLTGAGLMGLMMKNQEDRITVHFKGDGPAKQILAAADGSGRVKGYIANPDVDLPLREDGKLDVGGAMGVGTLTVIKDLGLKEPYVGRIDLVSGEIAEDLTAYFFVSEQQSSSVALGVRIQRDLTVSAAGGMIIQMLPYSDPDAVTALEEAIGQMKPLSTLVEEIQDRSGGKTQEAMLRELLAEIFSAVPEQFQPEILEFREIGWCCDCSEARMEKALLSIGEKDLREIYEEDGQAELVCQFCLNQYQFDKPQLAALLEEIQNQ